MFFFRSSFLLGTLRWLPAIFIQFFSRRATFPPRHAPTASSSSPLRCRNAEKCVSGVVAITSPWAPWECAAVCVCVPLYSTKYCTAMCSTVWPICVRLYVVCVCVLCVCVCFVCVCVCCVCVCVSVCVCV